MYIDDKIKELEHINIQEGINILQHKNARSPDKIFKSFCSEYYEANQIKESNHYVIKRSNAFIKYAHDYNIKMDINENLYRLYTD